MHNMKVKTKYYNLLKSGKKTVELRLFDEKRQQIKTGDIITFSDLSDPAETFTAKVVRLHRADSFKNLCKEIRPSQAGFATEEELLTVLEEFYTPADQKKYGVIGIEVSLQA